MIELRCHCHKRLARWSTPVGGDGGQVELACRRCGPDCPTCHGFPTFLLHAPILVQPPEDMRALWRIVDTQAS